jgi:hypothetical protein
LVSWRSAGGAGWLSAHTEQLLRGGKAASPHPLIQQSVAKEDPEPKAISCYGLYLPELDQRWLRFVDGRPVSSITRRFLWWCAEKLQAAGKKIVLLISGRTLPGTSSAGSSGAGSSSTTERSKRAAME